MQTQIEMETMTAIKSAARKFTSNEIDWEQRRYEIAKDYLCAIQNSRAEINILEEHTPHLATIMADMLIAELKKDNNFKN